MPQEVNFKQLEYAVFANQPSKLVPASISFSDVKLQAKIPESSTAASSYPFTHGGWIMI
jgi:hypothetical protein